MALVSFHSFEFTGTCLFEALCSSSLGFEFNHNNLLDKLRTRAGARITCLFIFSEPGT